MPSADSAAFKDEMVALLNQVAPVTARSMFGGYGLYTSGTMFALIADTTLYFKVDASNQSDYEAEEMQPFTYEGKGKPIQMSYWELPQRLLGEPEQLQSWLEKSLAAARLGKSKSRRKAKGSEPMG
ncbi:MAG: TfoX/Sxy family protein [Cyanobacteria bacterium J06632_22]